MTYYPYFRGKQYELIAVRESASLMASSGFVPIIEPVKQSQNALRKALTAVADAGGRAVVIVNPFHGDYSADGIGISRLLDTEFSGYSDFSAGILLKEKTRIDDIMRCRAQHENREVSLVHAGFADARELRARLGDIDKMEHIFLEELSGGKLYQKHFGEAEYRVLLRDGFERRRNRDHPVEEFFSDLHITYTDESMNGFGDFLIVGDDYSESGGPAYAVAIHLTYIDPDRDDAMYIYHFKSNRQDTPTDPAGKFGEALAKLVSKLNSPDNKLHETEAISEFRDLSRRGHFPGLGYVKKLSMEHHIQTLSFYLGR